jgi:cobalt/nickel transport system permease protein
MGVVGTLGGFSLYLGLVRVLGGEERARVPAAGIAAWTSVVAGAICMALELAASGTTALSIALPAMVGVHLLIGIGEALITMGALAFIAVTRADLLRLRDSRPAAA